MSRMATGTATFLSTKPPNPWADERQQNVEPTEDRAWALASRHRKPPSQDPNVQGLMHRIFECF